MSLLVSILIVIKLDHLMCFYLPCGCEQIPDKKQLKGGRFDFGLWSEGIQSIMEGKTWRWEVVCSYLSRLGTREKLKKANTQLTFSFFFSFLIWFIAQAPGIMLSIFGVDLPSSVKPLWKILTDKVNSKPVKSEDSLPHVEISTKMGIGFSKWGTRV